MRHIIDARPLTGFEKVFNGGVGLVRSCFSGLSFGVEETGEFIEMLAPASAFFGVPPAAASAIGAVIADVGEAGGLIVDSALSGVGFQAVPITHTGVSKAFDVIESFLDSAGFAVKFTANTAVDMFLHNAGDDDLKPVAHAAVAKLYDGIHDVANFILSYSEYGVKLLMDNAPILYDKVAASFIGQHPLITITALSIGVIAFIIGGNMAFRWFSAEEERHVEEQSNLIHEIDGALHLTLECDCNAIQI